MSILNSVLKVFVGDKSQKDVKAVMPLVEKIKAEEKNLENLSLDELRAKTDSFKNSIAEATQEVLEEIEHLKEKAQATEDMDAREEIY
ncbi:MAG: hypothetical protein RQ756_01505, partial [Flavobacteriaceae bacterium]|nr:hypothetical protein [Flavobacteriaceae bacterium]